MNRIRQFQILLSLSILSIHVNSFLLNFARRAADDFES